MPSRSPLGSILPRDMIAFVDTPSTDVLQHPQVTGAAMWNVQTARLRVVGDREVDNRIFEELAVRVVRQVVMNPRACSPLVERASYLPPAFRRCDTLARELAVERLHSRNAARRGALDRHGGAKVVTFLAD